ncbi:AIPR family protein [Aquabacter sediminis]|uniref:AIPR family protein n=1 Tax=Aquabacter sediminis TaxID=3029197 RepID=UPI00237EE4B2|nr:AIPR family protein [Aquabacter sp. P-9]MDE1568804.1 AIPR family protein [Aquabacter sp. P-9]
MLEEKLLAEFAAGLRDEANDRLIELPTELPLASETALAEVILGYLEEAGSIAGHDLCPHEDVGLHRPCRVIAYSLPEDSVRLELFTTLGLSADPVLARRDIGRLSGWAARFFEYAAKGDHVRFANNPAALEAAALIQTELLRIEEVRINVLTDARVRDRAVDDIVVQGRRVETEVWDIERLYRATGEDVTRDRIEIDFAKMLGRPLACLEMKPRPAEYETYMVILPGKLIYDLFDQYGPRLFEFNVRSFLQAKGAVNKGIQRTIREEPGRFLAYNNGLTATADEIEVSTWHGETVINRLRGLQIVNGAQTTASIHRALKVDKLPLDQVAVSMKLTLVPPEKLEEFVPLIARFANTQNPIQVADLSASDRFHQQFEALSESVWPPGEESRWFYERARGSYQMARNRHGSTPARRREFDRTCPRSQHFGKTDLAKYLMAWWGSPQIVSRGAQKNYATFMFSLRERLGEAWSPDKDFFRRTIAKALLFKAAQGVVRKARLQSYGANVVAYMIALLASHHGDGIDLKRLWDEQQVSSEMEALFAMWAPQIHAEIVASAGNRNVTEWCKKDDCWAEIGALNLPLPSAMPPEFRDAAPASKQLNGSEDHSESDDDLIAECVDLDGAAWARIMAWAAATPAIDDYDRKVVHTLSGYAMNGWIKRPSSKQAVRGSRVLNAARSAGVAI